MIIIIIIIIALMNHTISFHVQVVVPVMLVKPTDTSPLAFANISPPTKIPTSLST